MVFSCFRNRKNKSLLVLGSLKQKSRRLNGSNLQSDWSWTPRFWYGATSCSDQTTSHLKDFYLLICHKTCSTCSTRTPSFWFLRTRLWYSSHPSTQNMFLCNTKKLQHPAVVVKGNKEKRKQISGSSFHRCKTAARLNFRYCEIKFTCGVHLKRTPIHNVQAWRSQ